MTKLPALIFYVGDWRKDLGVQSLPFHERGVWFEMLCLMHESEQRGKLLLNGKPMSEEVLSRLLGLDRQVLTNSLNTILDAGVASRDATTGLLFCRRMVRDEALRQIRTECGKKGGNPALLNQNSTNGVKGRDKIEHKLAVEAENEDAVAVASEGKGFGEGKPIFVPFKASEPPSLEAWLQNAMGIGYDQVDADTLWHELDATGWVHRGQQIRDWRKYATACRGRHQQRVNQDKTRASFRNGKPALKPDYNKPEDAQW